MNGLSIFFSFSCLVFFFFIFSTKIFVSKSYFDVVRYWSHSAMQSMLETKWKRERKKTKHSHAHSTHDDNDCVSLKMGSRLHVASSESGVDSWSTRYFHRHFFFISSSFDSFFPPLLIITFYYHYLAILSWGPAGVISLSTRWPSFMCVCVCMTTHIIEECNELNARAKTRLPTATENQSEKVEDG